MSLFLSVVSLILGVVGGCSEVGMRWVSTGPSKISGSEVTAELIHSTDPLWPNLPGLDIPLEATPPLGSLSPTISGSFPG